MGKIINKLRAVDPFLFIFILYAASNLLVDRLLFQAIVLVGFIFILYWTYKNMTLALWSTLLMTVFFNFGRYFSFPFSTPLSDGVEAYTVFGVSAAQVVLLLLLYWLKRSRVMVQTRIGVVDILLGLFLLWAMVGCYFSPFADVSWYALFILLNFISLFYVSRILFWKQHYYRAFIIALVSYITLNSLLMIGEKLNGGLLGLKVEDYFVMYGNYAQDSPGLFRPGGMNWDANVSASLLVMGLLLLINLWAEQSEFIPKKLATGVTLILAVALIISASRGSWLVALGLIALCIFSSIVRKKRTVGSLFTRHYVVAFALFVFLFGGFVANRFNQLASDRGVSTINTRWLHLKLGAQIAQNFVTGSGLNTFQYQIMTAFLPEQYLYDSTPAHMMVGELMGDMGYVGLILAVILFYALFRHFVVSSRWLTQTNPIQNSIFYMAISYMLLAQIYPLLFSIQISAIFWILMGAMYEKN